MANELPFIWTQPKFTTSPPREADPVLRDARGGIDLVVSDLRMPDVDGTALIEALREREGRVVPLILAIVLNPVINFLSHT